MRREHVKMTRLGLSELHAFEVDVAPLDAMRAGMEAGQEYAWRPLEVVWYEGRYVILDGRLRALARQQRGERRVPALVWMATELPPERWRAFRYRDGRNRHTNPDTTSPKEEAVTTTQTPAGLEVIDALLARPETLGATTRKRLLAFKSRLGKGLPLTTRQENMLAAIVERQRWVSPS
jgi:hypothetical protein